MAKNQNTFTYTVLFLFSIAIIGFIAYWGFNNYKNNPNGNLFTNTAKNFQLNSKLAYKNVDPKSLFPKEYLEEVKKAQENGEIDTELIEKYNKIVAKVLDRYAKDYSGVNNFIVNNVELAKSIKLPQSFVKKIVEQMHIGKPNKNAKLKYLIPFAYLSVDGKSIIYTMDLYWDEGGNKRDISYGDSEDGISFQWYKLNLKDLSHEILVDKQVGLGSNYFPIVYGNNLFTINLVYEGLDKGYFLSQIDNGSQFKITEILDIGSVYSNSNLKYLVVLGAIESYVPKTLDDPLYKRYDIFNNMAMCGYMASRPDNSELYIFNLETGREIHLSGALKYKFVKLDNNKLIYKEYNGPITIDNGCYTLPQEDNPSAWVEKEISLP